MLESARDRQYENWKFQASLKGINLDEETGGNKDSFENVKMRAQAKLNGVSEEQLHFQAVGFGMEEE